MSAFIDNPLFPPRDRIQEEIWEVIEDLKEDGDGEIEIFLNIDFVMGEWAVDYKPVEEYPHYTSLFVSSGDDPDDITQTLLEDLEAICP